MSEELTKAIRDEVVLFLKDSLANRTYELTYKAVNHNESPVWSLVVAEVDKIIDQYIEGGRSAEVKEASTEPQKIEVGDLVRLTGKLWPEMEILRGSRQIIDGIDAGEPYFIDSDGGRAYVYSYGDLAAQWGGVVEKKASEL